jgi:site-specific DNA-cytosine methylase
LEGEGFEVQCFLIPASGIGAWHQRYRVWIVGHSQHNGLLAAEKRCRDEKDYGGSQKGQNETIKFERTSGSRDYENVSNTNTRLGIGENEEVQTRRETIDSSSSRGREENVSNTTSKRLEREFGKKLQGARVRSTNSSEDVSNTDSGMRRGWRTIGESGENKVWRFYSEEEEQARVDIWSETIGRNAVYREGETDVSQSNNERQQKFNISKESRKKNISDWGYDTDETKQTWWQIESDLCGVPNGISYELDKDRANRIKTLGNAIVPQIAREFGLAIKKVLVDEDII